MISAFDPVEILRRLLDGQTIEVSARIKLANGGALAARGAPGRGGAGARGRRRVSTAVSAAGARPGWPALAGWVLALAAVGFAAWVYWGLGPRAKSRDWWEPKASVARALSETSLAPLVEELPVALGGFGLAALALAAAVFATTRSAVARFLAVFGVLATLCFVFYAVEARFVWSFFRWRWSASLALFARGGRGRGDRAAARGELAAPALAAARRPLPADPAGRARSTSAT